MSRDFITIEQPLSEAPVSCEACGWEGEAKHLSPPDGAILTPGDPCPAGRCPSCQSLAYLAPTPEVSMQDSLQTFTLDCCRSVILHARVTISAGSLDEAAALARSHANDELNDGDWEVHSQEGEVEVSHGSDIILARDQH